MVTIEFNPETLELKANGHAGGIAGADIVCASVSMLFYTLAQCLLESKEMLIEDPVIKDAENEPVKVISCKPKEEAYGTIARTYWTILTGIKLLADYYPEKIFFKLFNKMV